MRELPVFKNWNTELAEKGNNMAHMERSSFIELSYFQCSVILYSVFSIFNVVSLVLLSNVSSGQHFQTWLPKIWLLLVLFSVFITIPFGTDQDQSITAR